MNIEVRHLRTHAELALADLFDAAKRSLPGDSRVAASRAAAFASFAAAGLPHRRVEAWRYTDLRNLMRDARPLAAPPDAASITRAANAGAMLAGLGCRRLVVVDGVLAPELSDLAGLESGLTVGSMGQALASGDLAVLGHLGKVFPTEDAALALNTALMGDGVVIRLAPGAIVERPIHLAFVTTGDKPAAIFTRSLAVLGNGARVMLIETHEGPERSPYQVNTALEVVIDDLAQLDHVKVTREGDAALHVASLLAALGARAHFNAFGFTTGGAVVRNQLFVRLAGEGTLARLGGASLLTGRQHADTTLVVDHAAAACESRQVFKPVLDGEARSVFQGRITVARGAQKTDARMMTRALLLSEAAEADSKPELEIFADDVQCGHGATAGTLDDELKFYLMARGIPAPEAEALLIEAFVGEAVEAIGHEGVREVLMQATRSWLGSRG
jgi:Fe-S cluster assembly protein SufD